MRSLPLLLAAALLQTASAAPDTARVVRVACVGDSITYGAELRDRASESYPAVLQSLLGDGFEVRNFGVSGATLLRSGQLSYWDVPEFEYVAEFEPDLIVLMLGTNDSWLHNWKHGADFARDLRDMLDHFAALPSKPRVWVCLPPPVFGMMRSASNAILDQQIIPRIRQAAGEKNVPVIDVNGALRGRGECFPDSVHPDAAGAAIIARTVFDTLRAGSPPPR
ncbi:MAG: GDSL-type esterase/lipase family protein [Verrucomicrobiota bacterium]